jgi:hypothetical protein
VVTASTHRQTESTPSRMERRDLPSRERLVSRVVGEYQQMPGLTLTALQARRLFGLDMAACERVLSGLVSIGFLTLTRHGMYQRRDLSV